MRVAKNRLGILIAKAGGALEKSNSPSVNNLSRSLYSAASKIDIALGSFRQGNRLYKLGEYEAAIPFLQKAFETGFPSVEAPRRLAIAHYENEAPTLAREVIESAIRDARYSPEDRKVLEKLLDAVQASGVEHAPMPEPRGNRTGSADRKSALKPWQKAEAMARDYEKESHVSSWLYKYADTLQNCGRLKESATEFSNAYAKSNGSSWYAYRAGLAYELAGNLSESEFYYGEAIRLDKKFNSAKFGIAPFHAEKGYFDLAADAFASKYRTNARAQDRADIALRAARMYAQVLNIDCAVEFYEKALVGSPFKPSLLMELSHLLELAEQYEEAARYSQAATALARSNDQKNTALWSLARQLASQGLYQKAAELYHDILAGRCEKDGVNPQISVTDDFGADRYLRAAIQRFKPEDAQGALHAFDLAQRLGLDQEIRRIFDLLKVSHAYIDRSVLQFMINWLMSARQFEEICMLARQADINEDPHLYGQKRPAAGSHAQRLAKYAAWCDLPLQENVVFYESNLGLSIDCNPYAIYRKLQADSPQDLIHVWAVDGSVNIPEDVQQSANTIVINKSSLAYTKLLATAKYIINNSTFPTYFTRREGQKYLMTWHGTPLKTLGNDQREAMTHGNMARNYLQASHAIFPNEHTREVMIDHQDIGEVCPATIAVTGYPRNDVLVDNAGPTQNECPVALFAPTWRETDSMEAQAEHLVQVGEQLRAAGFKPLLRAHHYVETVAQEKDPSLEFVDRAVSTYDILPTVDLLVTDYSSIYFDFAVTKRPIVFFVPDWAEYKEARGVYFDKNELPGTVCENYEDLSKALGNYAQLPLPGSSFLDRFCPHEDGHATSRTIELLFGGGNDTEIEPHVRGGVDGKPTVLFRQSFVPNGMASSFINLSKQLVRNDIGVTVLTPGESLRADEGRQQTLCSLPSEVKVIGRVGPIIKSELEYHYAANDRKRTRPRPEFAQIIHERMYGREAQRILPNTNFDAYIEFDGYSEFMADVMIAISNGSSKTGIYLHSDIVSEAKTRMPELFRIINGVNNFDRVVSVSQRLMALNSQRFKEECGVTVENPCFIENSIVGEEIVAKSLMAPEVELPVEFAEEFFVHVGRFSPEKNHDFLIDVFTEILSFNPSVKLVLVGDGPERERIQKRVDQLGLDKNVFFTGLVKNPYPYIAMSRGVLLPSLHEGQPMVILEASCLGIPVFGSDIDAVVGMKHLVDLNMLPLETSAWVEALQGENSDQTRRLDYASYEAEAIEQFRRVFLS